MKNIIGLRLFFTEGNGFGTDVRYGANLTLGNTGVASTEFLTRFFSHKDNLYSDEGKIIINNDVGRKALEELVRSSKICTRKNCSLVDYSCKRICKWKCCNDD